MPTPMLKPAWSLPSSSKLKPKSSPMIEPVFWNFSSVISGVAEVPMKNFTSRLASGER